MNSSYQIVLCYMLLPTRKVFTITREYTTLKEANVEMRVFKSLLVGSNRVIFKLRLSKVEHLVTEFDV